MVRIDSIENKTISGAYTDDNIGCKLLKTVIMGVVKIEFGISEEPVNEWFKLNIKNGNTSSEKNFNYKCKY